MNLLLDWLPSLDMGIPAIDDDHRRLVADSAGLVAALQRHDPWPAIADAAARMEAEFTAHARCEEAILGADSFPGVAAHEAEHHALTRRLQKVVRSLQELAARTDTAAVMTELVMLFRSLLIEHMLMHDLRYKSHVQWLRGR